MAEPIMKVQYGESWIQKTPDVVGGDACIRTTRVPVWAVIETLRRGVSKEQLQTYFVRELTGADIEAALAYFQNHMEEIDEQIRLNREA